MSYTVYAINKDGDGYSQKIGVFDDLDEIRLRVGLFAPDVVLEIVEEFDQEDKKQRATTTATSAPAVTTAVIPNVRLK